MTKNQLIVWHTTRANEATQRAQRAATAECRTVNEATAATHLETIRHLQEQPRENDITIMWDNKPTYNRHKVAIDIQDACNMRAIAREFVKVVEAAAAELNHTGIWVDPAVILMINKLDSLCGGSNDQFSPAYALCKANAKAGDWRGVDQWGAPKQ